MQSVRRRNKLPVVDSAPNGLQQLINQTLLQIQTQDEVTKSPSSSSDESSSEPEESKTVKLKDFLKQKKKLEKQKEKLAKKITKIQSKEIKLATSYVVEESDEPLMSNTDSEDENLSN